MGKVTFKLERDNRPLVEQFDAETMNDLFFHRQYSLAIKLVARYLDEEKKAPKESLFESYTDRNNNLFAFVGDRGTGKTSCMLSVANSLINKEEHAFKQEAIDNSDFFTIGLLDPSYFDSEHDILMLFVAKLFSMFTEEANKFDLDGDKHDDKSKLLKDFAATQKHIHSLLQKANNIDGDEFEQLTSYAVALDLKKDIFRLIDDYRKLIDKPKAIMLLMVDDIDLNTAEASKMAELLRKYFVHPHTIVFISVKLDQLSYIKKLDLTKEFERIVGHGIEYQEIDEMAERYLSKFMPQEHRIFLPTPDLYFDNELTIIVGDKTRSFCSVKQAIPELIYWKTRYLFYNFDGEANFIVPRNLRDFRQLLKVLVEMDGSLDCFEPDMTLAVKERNRMVFQNYLYEDWLVNNLDNETVRLVKHVVNAEGANQLNNAILQVLKEKFAKDIDDAKVEEIKYIISANNKSFNISIGDIIGLLDLLSTKKVGVADKKLIFILSTVLSMRLYTFEQEMRKEDSLRASDEEVSPQRYKDDSENYFKLIGGRLINTKIMELLPRKNNNSSSRSNRIIERKAVEALLKQYVNGETNDYRAFELFMLCTFRSTSSRQETYRAENRIVHSDFQGGRDFVFEIGSLFNNILDLDNCYQRFAALGGDYKTVVDSIKEGKGTTKTFYSQLEAFRTNMAFRSMDLLQYFINYIGGVHYAVIEDPFSVIMNFLRHVSHFEFSTYKPITSKDGSRGMTKESFSDFGSLFDSEDDSNMRVQFNSLFGDEIDHETTGSTEDASTTPHEATTKRD